MMLEEKYRDKYGRREVCNFEIYDTSNNLITIIDTVNKDEFSFLRNKSYLRITDVVIDQKFFDYLSKNVGFEGSIRANTLLRRLSDDVDYKAIMFMPVVKLRSYKLKSIYTEYSIVNLTFELIKSSRDVIETEIKAIELS